jgi:hypothetical protein
MISRPGAIRTGGQVLIVAEDGVKMGCDVCITVCFVPEGRLPTGFSGEREKKRGGWKSMKGKETPTPKDRKSI